MNEQATSENPKPSGRPGPWERPVVICLLLAVATLAVYWPLRHCNFLNYDDPDYVTSNHHVLAGLTGPNLVWAFTTGQTGNWHPLTWLSLMLDVNVYGTGPAGFHATNLLFHLANTLLLFLLLRRLTAATWRSAFVAALFALHPLHVESVAWVAERKDVLSTCFGLLALIAYARYAQNKANPNPQPSTLNYTLTLIFFALSLMSKPMLVTLPLVMLLLDWWPLQRISEFGVRGSELKNSLQPAGVPKHSEHGPTLNRFQLPILLLEKWPFFLLSAVSCAVTFLAQQKGGAVMTLVKISLAQRVDNAFISYSRYLAKTFWPAKLANPYPYPDHWPVGWVVLSAVLFVGLSVTAVWAGRKRPFVPVGWFWFVGTLIPVIGLVQVGNQSMADRYTYFPLIGIFLVVTWGAAGLGAGRRLPGSVIGVLGIAGLLACGLRTRDQLRHWQDSGTLWRHALAVTKNNFVACNNLGTWLSGNGQSAEAMDWFRQSLQIQPDNPDALYNLGNAFARQGQWDEAVDRYRRARQLAPDQADILDNLGLALAAKQQYAEAIACFEAALKRAPDSASTHNNLATVLFIDKQYDEAARQYREAYRLAPGNAQISANLGDVLVRLGKPAEAAACYREALRLKPDDSRIQARLQALERTNSP